MGHLPRPLRSTLPIMSVLRLYVGNRASVTGWIVVGKTDSSGHWEYTLRSIGTGIEHIEPWTEIQAGIEAGYLRSEVGVIA